MFSVTSCETNSYENNEKFDENYFTVYLSNIDMNGLLPVKINLKENKTEENISEILDVLKKNSDEDEAKASIPEQLTIKSIKLDSTNVVINFGDEYNELSIVDEILLRSSVVKSLTELEGVKTVEFYIDGIPFKNATGNLQGPMDKSDVILDFEGTILNDETRVVTLYFPNNDGSVLIPVDYEISMNSDEQLEKRLLDLLIAGPPSSDLSPSIPAEAKVKNIYTNGGICYVDFNEAFVTKHPGGSTGETNTIYSVVNTLTELPNISKVQFLIEGEVREAFKGHFAFNTFFERNLDLVGQ